MKEIINRFPIWLLSIVVFIFLLIIIEQLYVSKRPVDLWGLKLNQIPLVDVGKSLNSIKQTSEYLSKTKMFGSSTSAIKFERKVIALTTSDYHGNARREPFEKKAADIFCKKMGYSESDGYIIKIDANKKFIPAWRFNPDGSKESRDDYSYFQRITCIK